MKDMKNSPILKTGDIFRAKDKLGNVYCYEFEGFDLGDLGDLDEGIGCRYIILKNLDLNELVAVEAAWFHYRDIIREV